MSNPRPDGRNAGVPGAPYMSEAPLSASSERALHAAMQRLYCDRVRTHVNATLTSPIDIQTDDEDEQFVFRAIVELRPGVTSLRAFVRFSAMSPSDRAFYSARYGGAPFMVGARMYTYTVANPPVLITTGTENVQAVALSYVEAMAASGESRVARDPDMMRYDTFVASAQVTPDTSGTREQIVDIYLRDAMESALGAAWSVTRLQVRGIALVEVPLESF